MHTETIDVHTPRGTMPVHLARPDGADDAPLVVLYMDALGIRQTLHDHATRLVEAGYATALPDLYYVIDPEDRPDIGRLAAGDPAEFARMGAVVGRMVDEDVLKDTALLLEAVGIAEDQAWGCVGFCMGGRFGLEATAHFPTSLAAASLLHPSRLVTDEPDSPHRHLDGARAALYLGFGENDHVTPLAVIPPLRDELEAHEIPNTIEIIPNADHGYTMPGMPAYNETAAEQAWAGTIELFRATF